MLTLLYPKNNKINANNMHESGFTLLECILAIGILSVVVASIVGLQSSIISVTQIASDNMRASWAVKSTVSQVQYILDMQGQANIPEGAFPWATDSQFSIKVTRTELKDVKASQFLTSAMGVYNLVSPDGNENLDIDRTISPIVSVLDSSASIPQGYFSNVNIVVTWMSGITEKKIDEGFFFIDKDILSNVTLPDLGGNKNNNSSNNNTNNPNSGNNNSNNPPPGGSTK